jgi:hypothetical protein
MEQKNWARAAFQNLMCVADQFIPMKSVRPARARLDRKGLFGLHTLPQ